MKCLTDSRQNKLINKHLNKIITGTRKSAFFIAYRLSLTAEACISLPDKEGICVFEKNRILEKRTSLCWQ